MLMKLIGFGTGGKRQKLTVGEIKMDCEIGDWYKTGRAQEIQENSRRIENDSEGSGAGAEKHCCRNLNWLDWIN